MTTQPDDIYWTCVDIGTVSYVDSSGVPLRANGALLTAPLILPSGSEANASLQGPSDPDTGLRFPASNRLSLQTNGSSAIEISDDQTVRIGGGNAATNPYTIIKNDSEIVRNYNFSGAPAGIRVNNFGITSTQQGSVLAISNFGVSGADGGPGGSIELRTTANWGSSANRSAQLVFRTTTANSNAIAASLNASGLYLTGALYVANIVVVDTDRGISFPTYTQANYQSVTHAVNTANKRAGKVIFDTTNNRLMVANGNSVSSPWYIVDGSSSITPS